MTERLRFAVIGSPVAHSRSPLMHAAAYRALDLPHVYEKIQTSAEELPARVRSLRDGVYAGLNVTVPHKTAVLALVDELDTSARAMGAANTLVRTGGGLRAYNTDGPALASELERLAKDRSVFHGRSALVLGTGGAARAAIFALGRLGIGHVIVRGRTDNPALADVLRASGSDAPMSYEHLDAAPSSESRDLVAIVQATTAGMDGASAPGDLVANAIAWASVPSDCIVYDVVYAPPRTPLLHRASSRGLVNDGGLRMLVRQGALAFELWLGVAPPLDVMVAAVTLAS